jgi:hypothetical protein
MSESTTNESVTPDKAKTRKIRQRMPREVQKAVVPAAAPPDPFSHIGHYDAEFRLHVSVVTKDGKAHEYNETSVMTDALNPAHRGLVASSVHQLFSRMTTMVVRKFNEAIDSRTPADAVDTAIEPSEQTPFSIEPTMAESRIPRRPSHEQ